MALLLEMDKDEEELILPFLRLSNLEHILQEYTLVPVEEYGSEGLMPLKGRCPEYTDTDISCVGGSGDNACGCFMGTETNFSLIVKCNGGTK